MKETVPAMAVRKRLGDMLNRVDLRHDEFIIERKGRPLAALVPVAKLEHLEKLARKHGLAPLEGQGTTKTPQAEADRIANEAKHNPRRKR